MLISVVFFSLFSRSIGYAQTPTYSYTVTSPSNNAFPLQSTTTNMVQWLFTPSDFSPTVPTGVNITTIYLKPSTITSGSNPTFTSFQIKIGNTSLNSLVSGTWNTGLTTVLSSASYGMTVSGTNWIPITLTTPFYYSGSNFIVEISQLGYGTTGGLNLAHDYTNAGRRMYGSATGSTGTAGTGQLIFGFDAGPANCTGTPTIPVLTTAPMTPAAPLCANSTMALAASYTFINGITYQWQSAATSTGPWANVTNGTGATTLNYTTGPVPSTTWYRLGVTCSTSNITSYSAPYQVIVGAAQPSNILGLATFCPGDTATYSVVNVPGTVYTWTLPAGWSGFSSSSSILTTPGTTGGTISVTAASSCGTSIPQTRTIVAGGAPAQPGNINGNAAICANTTQTYNVTPVTGATNYIWTLPSGWTGSSTSNSITTTTNGSGGTVSVISVNGCGQSTARTLTVNVITTLANPGTITGPASVCSGSLQNYSINPVPGATSYTWTFPSGWSGTTSGTSIQAFAGTTGGNVNVTAFVSCATSPISSLPVTVIPTLNPAVSIATNSTTLCQGFPIVFTATPTNGGTTPQYQWKKNGVNVAGAGSSYLNNSLVTGDVISVVMTSTYACPATPTATSNAITANITPSVIPGINISTTPTINICAGTPLNFNTNITGGGTSPAYQWYKNGFPVVGATGTSYTDAGLMDQDTITVELTSNAVCATSPTAMSNKVLISVTDVVVPSISISASSTILNGAPITFTATQSGGGATPQYQWMKNNVDIPLATADNYTATGLNNGDRIAVKMLSYAPCANPELVASNEIIVTSPLSVASVGGWDGAVSLYPNPNTGHFSIAAAWGAAHNGKRIAIDIMNAIGQSVYHSEVAPDRAQWHYDVQMAEGLANGSYMLRLSGDGMKATVPFVLNR
jgi:hypothetical protein